MKYWIREFIKCWSNEDSFFSLKRIERTVCFTTAIYFEWSFYSIHKTNMTVVDFLSLVIPIFTMAGLSIAATQKEKLDAKPQA